MKKTAIVLFLISTAFCTAQTNPTNVSVLSADQQESPAGSGNGIAMSMRECASQSHVCQIVAPALYSLKEAQPWDSGNNAYEQYQQFGPKGSDPVGCVLDQRFGGPQFICNNGVPSTTNPNTVGAPMFSMSVTSVRTGQYPKTPPSLFLTHDVFSGGHDFWYDEVQNDGFRMMNEIHSQASSTQIRAVQREYSPSDNIGLDIENYGVGIGLRQNEGHEFLHGRSGEMAEVYDGTVNSSSCAASGDCIFSLTAANGQWPRGMMGEGLALIDLTNADTSGYVAAITGGTIKGSSSADWAKYGTSATTTTTASISDVGGGGIDQTGTLSTSRTNTFPRANQVIPVASTAGFSAGQVVCLFDAQNPVWMCSKITAVGNGAITVAVMHYPLILGSTVAAGGLTGYGFSLDADSTTKSNGKTYDPSEPPASGTTIRVVYPIISSDASSNTLKIFDGWAGGSSSFQTYAYPAMGGSGGTAAATISGGAVSSCSASGGSGYTTNTRGAPPQLVVSATPAWTNYPVLAVTGSGNGGSLNGCAVVSAGTQGSGGALTVSVVPSNPYHIFPQARTWQVWNPVTGGIDGTAVQTTPVVGAFNKGDQIEQPHYFANKVEGLSLYNYTFQAAGSHSNLNIITPGTFATNDYEAQFANLNLPTVYGGYPAGATPWAIGSAGTLGTPYGLVLRGPHRNGLQMSLPPFGGNGGSLMAGLFIQCGSAEQCAKWNSTIPVLGVANPNLGGNANDVWGYNPVTQTWSATAGAKSANGANPSCTFSFGPNGFSESGSSCSGSPAPAPSSSGNGASLSATTGRIGGSPLQTGACVSGAVSIPGATTSMVVVATPANDPGDGIFWQGYVQSPGSVIVKVCAATAETPTPSAYNVRVIP